MNHRCAALFMSAVDVSPSINPGGEVVEGEVRGEVSPKTTWPLQAVHQSSEVGTTRTELCTNINDAPRRQL